MTEQRTITRDVYLKALGLFTLATDHYRIMREAELKANEVLGLDPQSGTHVSDEIYTDGGGNVRGFDDALKRENIEVEST